MVYQANKFLFLKDKRGVFYKSPSRSTRTTHECPFINRFTLGERLFERAGPSTPVVMHIYTHWVNKNMVEVCFYFYKNAYRQNFAL